MKLLLDQNLSRRLVARIHGFTLVRDILLRDAARIEQFGRDGAAAVLSLFRIAAVQ